LAGFDGGWLIEAAPGLARLRTSDILAAQPDNARENHWVRFLEVKRIMKIKKSWWIP
jgi:hypothetical protein